MRRKICFILLLSISLCCCSCSAKKANNQPNSASFKCFDTICTVTIYDKMTKKDFRVVFNYIKDKCNTFDHDYFSKTKENSFVSNLNKYKEYDAYEKYVRDILNQSTSISKKTNGAFDITISPIIDLWDIQNKNASIPSDKKINKELKLVDYSQLSIKQEIAKLNKNGSIDLGAIAKGFVTDELLKDIKSNDIKSMILDFGGNIYVRGKKNNKDFKVGIKRPFGNGELSAIVKTHDKAVVTSGIYQRYKKVDGKIYSHIMDPKTGRPVNNDLYSVTVISDNSTTADALSTGLMVMGLDKGMKLANKTDDIEAVLIDKNNKLHLTDGLVQKGKEITIK